MSTVNRPRYLNQRNAHKTYNKNECLYDVFLYIVHDIQEMIEM